MYFQPVAITFLSLATLATNLLPALGHGLMEYPPSRNQICGVANKPHEDVPECRPAFPGDLTGGYNFMSVLTHGIGRMGGRSNHVCGFDSESWQGGSTPWDTPMDWPTHPMTAGRNEIAWNIEWGPHFSDTEEFRYWITKPDFQFDAGRELSWDDFEEEPFCVLNYSDSNPTANPDVISDVQNTRFFTFCNVPPRAGHHVIYGEWGRNEWTYERFHGCIDAQFGEDGGDVPTTPTTTSSPITPAPTPAPVTPPPVLTNCNVHISQGRNPWYAGLYIGFDNASVVLDFSSTGLDLGSITVDTGNFDAKVKGQTITLVAPDWVSSTVTGYLGFHGNNVAALANFADPTCTTARRMLRQG